MAHGIALILTQADADDERADFSGTFTEVDPTAPVLAPGDATVQRGDGLFETIGVIGGHPREVRAHLDRFINSAALRHLPVPNRRQWQQAIARAAAACGPGEWAIKLVLGAERFGVPASARLTARPAPDFSMVRRDGVRVALIERGLASAAPIDSPWLLLGAKTTSYALNLAAIVEARRRGADEAVFVTDDGILLEAATSSLVLRSGDTFRTPDPGAGILHGTTQQSVFEHVASLGYTTEYATLQTRALLETDAAWLVSSVRLAVPITAVDAHTLPVDADGTAELNRSLLTPRD